MMSIKLLMNVAHSHALITSLSVTASRGYLPTGHKCTWYEAFYIVTAQAINDVGKG